MTKKQKYGATCYKCGEKAICRNCGQPIQTATPFSLWLRDQSEISSNKSQGFVTTNIDYMWFNYKNNQWMLIEEKRHGAKVSWSQRQQFRVIDAACRNDKNYHGMHLLVFENTTPEDGKIYLNHVEIDKDTLISFLRFEISFDDIKETMK